MLRHSLKLICVLSAISLLAGCNTMEGTASGFQEDVYSFTNEAHPNQPEYSEQQGAESRSPAEANTSAEPTTTTPANNPPAASTTQSNTSSGASNTTTTSNVIPVISQPVGVSKPTVSDKPIVNGPKSNDDSEVRSTPNTE